MAVGGESFAPGRSAESEIVLSVEGVSKRFGGTQALEAVVAVQIADDGHDAALAQPDDVLGPAREAVEPDSAAQERGGTQCDVAAANQQYPDHSRTPRLEPA